MADPAQLPQFSEIQVNQIQNQLEVLLQDYRETVTSLLQQEYFTWDNFIKPLEDKDELLHAFWSPISHVNAVMNRDELQSTYQACLPVLSEFETELGHNQALYKAYQAIRNSNEFKTLDGSQQKIINNALRDFHLAGVDLPADKKSQFKKLDAELSLLSNEFSQNVLEATQAWDLLVEDESELEGVPAHAMSMFKAMAEAQNKQGWLVTLDAPSYIAVLSHAKRRQLRETLYKAYITRASDEGPNAGEFDNGPVMAAILNKRQALAKLLGFPHYSALSLETKMAKDSKQVMGFLQDLAQRSKSTAAKEFEQLTQFAMAMDDLQNLQPWDVAYYSDQQRQDQYAFSEEQLRPYFPEEQVLKGLFGLVNKLYGLTIEEEKQFDSWHENVRLFSIYDENNTLRGQFYMDLYARTDKRAGAWMDDCRVRRRLDDDSIRTPVAFLVCNFSGPTDNKPALFSFDDVLTLFHEFGHGLHHMLTKIDYMDVSGIRGVAWDAVELPSQFMENFLWEREVIDLVSGHYETGEVLPHDLFEKVKAAKNYQSAMQMLRQLEFALFDFRLHQEFDGQDTVQIQQILNETRDEVSVVPRVDYNRFQHSFSHIFAGGYGAGYYSYKWAEVLSSDCYSRFEEEGIFNPKIGQDFLENILEKGGSQDALELFVAFRGREPKIDPLLRHSGLL